MADETFRSEVVIDVRDNTASGFTNAQQRLERYTQATAGAVAGMHALTAALASTRAELDRYGQTLTGVAGLTRNLTAALPTARSGFTALGAAVTSSTSRLNNFSSAATSAATKTTAAAQAAAAAAAQLNAAGAGLAGQTAAMRTVAGLGGGITRLGQSASTTHGILSALSTQFLGISLAAGGAEIGVRALVKSFDLVIAKPVELADTMSRARIGFDTMFKAIGREGQGDEFFKRVQDFAVKTPFEMAQTIQGAQRLLMARVSPDRIIPTEGALNRDGTPKVGLLEKVGDAVAAGGGGSNEVGRVLQGVARVYETGRFGARAVQAFTNANIPAWRYLAEGYQREVDPKANIDALVPMLRGMAERNQLPLQRGMRWIEEGMMGSHGQMQEQANKTFAGIKEQMTDAFSVNVVARWGAGLQRGALDPLQQMNAMLFANKETTKGLGDTLESAGRLFSSTFTSVLAGGVAAMMGDRPAFERIFYNLGMAGRDEFVRGFAGGGILQALGNFIQMALNPGRLLATAAVEVTKGATGGMEHDPRSRTGAYRPRRVAAGDRIQAMRDYLSGANTVVGRAAYAEAEMASGLEDARRFGPTMTPAEMRQPVKLTPAYPPEDAIKPRDNSFMGQVGDWFSFLDPRTRKAGASALEDAPAEAYSARGSGQANIWERAGRQLLDAADALFAAAMDLGGSGGGGGGGGRRGGGGGFGGVGGLAAGGDLTRSQFNDPALRQEFINAGFSASDIASACGPIMAEGMAKAAGITATAPQFLAAAQANKDWDSANGMHGPVAAQRMLKQFGIESHMGSERQAMEAIAKGIPVGISTSGGNGQPGHYYLAQGMNADGTINVGHSGEAMSKYGGSAAMTNAQIGGIGGGINGYIIQDTMSQTRHAAGGPGQKKLGTNNPALRAWARKMAISQGIDPDIFEHQIEAESGFDPNAHNPSGASGIAQMMPGTSRGLGIDAMDPYQALGGAAKMDADSLRRNKGDWRKALVEYNGGGGALQRYEQGRPYQESKDYLTRVLGEGNTGSAAPGRGGTTVIVQEGAVQVTVPITNMGALDPVQADKIGQHLAPAVAYHMGQAIKQGPPNMPLGTAR